MKRKKIVVIGMGPVGVVTAATFAEHGHQVVGVDRVAGLITDLNQGKPHIYEPGLKELLDQVISNGCLSFTDCSTVHLQESDVIFITVGTPFQNGKLDISAVEGVVESILDATSHRDRKIIAIRSTVTPGTNELIREMVRDLGYQHAIVSVPEFLSEGAAIRGAKYPDRIIVSTLDKWALPTLHELFEPFLRSGEAPFIDDIAPASAEFVKMFGNAMLALRISAMNDLAGLIEKTGTNADIEEIRRGIGADSRIGSAFLYAGCGFGGSCFPKDVAGLIEFGGGSPMLEAVLEINKRQKRKLYELAVEHFGTLRKFSFAVWGIAFKDGTNDTRESPGVELIRQLVDAGATVMAYDPHVDAQGLAEFNFPEAEGKVRLVKQPYDALQSASALFVTTPKGWGAFDYELAKTLMNPEPVIFDGRNLFNPKEMAREGFFCYSIGRPPGIPEM